MHSAHILKLLMAALSANTVTQGFILDAAILNRSGIELARRQGLVGDAVNNAGEAVTGSGGAPATTSASDDSTATTTTAAEATPTTTPRETTSTPTSQDAPTTKTSDNTPAPTTPSTDGTTAPSTSAGGTAATTASSETTSRGRSSSATTTAEPVTSTQIVVVTATDGSVSSSTAVTVSTPTPGLNEASNGSGGSSGMSTQTRNIIIGVVVGVGGAIVLAVAGLFAWRIWGRRKASEENDGLMSYNNGAEGKSEVGGLNVGSTQAGGPRSPFQSTLESYHAPSNVNASSNF